MAMIIGGAQSKERPGTGQGKGEPRCRRADIADKWVICWYLRGTTESHRPLSELVRTDLLQPFLQLLLIAGVGGEIDGLRLVEDAAQDEDRRLGAQGQGDRVARPGVDLQGGTLVADVDLG